MTVTWIIDKYLLADTLSESLPGIVRSAGHDCKETKYIPFSDRNEWSGPCAAMGPVVLYGTHGFIKQTQAAHYPGAYCNEDNLKFSVYSGKYDGGMFNADFQFLPWAHIKKLDKRRWATGMFIRPDAVTKSFGGRVIPYREWEHELSIIGDTSSVSDNTWCVVAGAKDITAEYRFFIVDGRVISGSQYRRDGRLDIRTDTSMLAQKLAREIADHPWQPDRAYTCDIAEDMWGTGVLELNSFACAGFYACDQKAIVDAVSDLALKDYQDFYAAA